MMICFLSQLSDALTFHSSDKIVTLCLMFKIHRFKKNKQPVFVYQIDKSLGILSFIIFTSMSILYRNPEMQICAFLYVASL